MAERTNWLLVSSPENFETSRARGFDIAGMKSRHRKKAERVQAGDRVIFYLTGVKAVGGVAEVTGPPFEEGVHIWDSNKPGEEYPFRFPIRLVCARPPGEYLSMDTVVHTLQYPKRWPAEHWTLAFQGNVHVLSDADYALIAEALGCPVAA
jgi:hypothetical protein